MSTAGIMNTDAEISLGCGGIMSLVWLYFTVCWVLNLFLLMGCDFDAPYREEVVYAIGVFSFFGSGITVWF